MGQSLSDSIGSMLASQSMTLEEALEVRLLIEPPLAGLAARRARPQDIAELDRRVEELARTVHDQERFGDADIEIHRHVAAITGNRLALALTAWISDVLLPSVRKQLVPALVEEAIVEQQRVLANAIRRGDAEAAEAAMRAHLMHTVEMVHAADQAAPPATGTPG
jgi:GntR family transcriptional repressor for pyruvate dehydrogenase complex